jgi:hypothetical protein
VFADFRRDGDYFASLFDLILTLYCIPFDSPAVADLSRTFRPGPQDFGEPESGSPRP